MEEERSRMKGLRMSAGEAMLGVVRMTGVMKSRLGVRRWGASGTCSDGSPEGTHS